MRILNDLKYIGTLKRLLMEQCVGLHVEATQVYVEENMEDLPRILEKTECLEMCGLRMLSGCYLMKFLSQLRK